MGEWLGGWVSDEWVCGCVGGWVSGRVREWLSAWVSGWGSVWVSEWVSIRVSVWVSELVFEWVSEWVREGRREGGSEWVREGGRCCIQFYYKCYFNNPRRFLLIHVLSWMLPSKPHYLQWSRERCVIFRFRSVWLITELNQKCGFIPAWYTHV